MEGPDLLQPSAALAEQWSVTGKRGTGQPVEGGGRRLSKDAAFGLVATMEDAVVGILYLFNLFISNYLIEETGEVQVGWGDVYGIFYSVCYSTARK